jgi:hypothetical protein
VNIHPIKTESDYDAALDAIERLWGASEDTQEGDYLDVLLVLVERPWPSFRPLSHDEAECNSAFPGSPSCTRLRPGPNDDQGRLKIMSQSIIRLIHLIQLKPSSFCNRPGMP